jgi:hypothetical protein
MAARKWLVRSLYLAFLAVLGGGAYWVYSYLRPDFIRRELIQQISQKFEGVDVEVGSATLNLNGSIAVADLRLTRRGDPERKAILHVPAVTLHHDKEKLNEGKLIVRKVEMFRPSIRIERDEGGKWNIDGILRPSKGEELAPIFVLHDARISFVDRKLGDRPIAEWQDVNATIVNDPQPVIAFEMRGRGKPTGPFAISGRFDQRAGFGGTFDLPDIPINADLARAVEAVFPDAGDSVRPMSGKASVHLDLAWQSGPTPMFYHDLKVSIRHGRYEHASLPLPFEEIEVDLRSRNGDITVDKATARSGPGTISLTLDLPRDPPQAPHSQPLNPPGGKSESLAPETETLLDFEDRLRSAQVSVTNLAVTPELFGRLPGKAQKIESMFKPSGTLSGSYTFRRGEGSWSKRLVIQPNGMEMSYRGFPYRVRNVRGTVSHTVTSTSIDHISLDLTGEGLGTTVAMVGTIRGSAPDADIDLRIEGKGATLDDELIDAMPDDNPAMLRRLHATAHGDFVALIRQNERVRRDHGPEASDNELTIGIKKGSMKYEAFPYSLQDLMGTLIVKTLPERPTQLPKSSAAPRSPNGCQGSLEFIDFRATHNGSRIRGSGRKDPAPGGSILTLSIDGEPLALDNDLRQALASIRLENTWTAFDPSARMNCAVRARLFVRSDPSIPIYPAEDLEIGISFAGATIRPNFFPITFTDLAGQVTYAKGRVELKNIRAKRGSAELTLPTVEVLFRPSGGYWADIRDLKLTPLNIDADFLSALPPGLKTACDELRLQGSMSLHATRIVVDDQPGPHIPRYLPGVVRGTAPEDEPNLEDERIQPIVRPAPIYPKPILPTIYWDGSITFGGATMKTGVTWENMHGKVASWGVYKSDRLGAVRANVAIDSAIVSKQPVESVTAQLHVDPRQPDVLQIPAIRGKLYGGDIGGEAWIVMDSPARYAVNLNAARVRLSEIGKHYQLPPKARIEGLATAQLYLANRFDERTGQPVLHGSGTIDVPNGKLLNLPVFLNLIKVVKLRVPDDTGFEEAHALFYIRGDRLRFGSLDLIGNAVSLAGEGEMTVDGTAVNFEFYPVWSKVREMFALPGEWSAISKKFLKIRVTGELDKLDYKAEPVPGIVEPVKRLMNRMKKNMER